MSIYSLSISRIHTSHHEWVIVELVEPRFIQHSKSAQPHATYGTALAEGIKALALLDGQPLSIGAHNVTRIRSSPDDGIEIPSFESLSARPRADGHRGD